MSIAVSISSFVQHIEENIYRKALVYRSIIVTSNEKECSLLRKQLEKKDYSAIIIDDIEPSIHYNDIDNRIVIISHNIFREFIEHLDRCEGGILESSYNFIAFSYHLDDEIVEGLVSYYVNKTNNNMNNTIILERNYANFLYFQECCS